MVNSILAHPVAASKKAAKEESEVTQDAPLAPLANDGALTSSNATETPQKSEEGPVQSAFIDAEKKPEDFRNYGKDTPRYETVRAFYEEQHAKQTYEFATKMKAEYTSTSRCTMPVWDALMSVISFFP